ARLYLHSFPTRRSSDLEGNIFENLGSLFGSSPSQEDSQIVNHIFGKNTNQVQQSLAEKSGLSTDKVAGILALLGPIIMGFIGKQDRKSTRLNSSHVKIS